MKPHILSPQIRILGLLSSICICLWGCPGSIPDPTPFYNAREMTTEAQNLTVPERKAIPDKHQRTSTSEVTCTRESPAQLTCTPHSTSKAKTSIAR
ncbi:MAG: hypothetical protein AAGJ35_06295 [Myxococcota bacterium]